MMRFRRAQPAVVAGFALAAEAPAACPAYLARMDSQVMPVVRVVVGGLTRRKVQSLVIGLVLLVSTAACVLALALV